MEVWLKKIPILVRITIFHRRVSPLCTIPRKYDAWPVNSICFAFSTWTHPNTIWPTTLDAGLDSNFFDWVVSFAASGAQLFNWEYWHCLPSEKDMVLYPTESCGAYSNPFYSNTILSITLDACHDDIFFDWVVCSPASGEQATTTSAALTPHLKEPLYSALQQSWQWIALWFKIAVTFGGYFYKGEICFRALVAHIFTYGSYH